MKHFYYYLIASLPMLEFGTKAPVSYDDFLARCREQLAKSDIKIIERTKLGPFEDTDDSFPTLEEWKRFEVSLRNEIAHFRATKFSKDPMQHVRGEYYMDPFVSGFAHWAVNQDSPIEAELYLDRVRWDKLEDMEKGRYFDIGYLVTYALKLQILGRWEKINSEGGMQILEGLVGR